MSKLIALLSKCSKRRYGYWK